MKFVFIVMGKSKFSFVDDGQQHYLKNIRHLADAEVVELRDHGELAKEAAAFQAAIKKQTDTGRAEVFLLDEKGKQYTSVDFSAQLKKYNDNGVHKFVFVIGGPYGFSKEIRDQYSLISFSKMTFPHDLIRIFLAEQVYRSLQILKGGKYHHDG